MAYVAGETASGMFYTGATGQTFTRLYSRIAGSAVTWNPTFTEIGSQYAAIQIESDNANWVLLSTVGTVT